MRAPNEGSNYGSAGLTVDSEYLGETLATYTEGHQLQRNSTHVIIPWNTTWTRYNGDPIANHQSTRILGFCTVQCIYDRITYSITYESFSDVGESQVWWRADFQSGSRVLKKGVLNLFLSISMAYNVISCQKVAENTQILKIAKFAM